MRCWQKTKEERFSPPPWFEPWFPGTENQWCATTEQRWPFVFFFFFFYSFFFSFSSIVVQCSIFDICKEFIVNFLHFCLCFCPIFCLLSSFHFLLFIFLSLFSLSFCCSVSFLCLFTFSLYEMFFITSVYFYSCPISSLSTYISLFGSIFENIF